MKKKMSLKELKVKSFTTTMREGMINTVKGGNASGFGIDCGFAPTGKYECEKIK